MTLAMRAGSTGYPTLALAASLANMVGVMIPLTKVVVLADRVVPGSVDPGMVVL